MKNYIALVCIVGMSLMCRPVVAQDAITYQGELVENGVALNDTADLVFRVYDAAIGGSLIGSPVTVANQQVVDGQFTVELDFGAGVFDGNPRWIEIDVRSPSGSGGYTTLDPRQSVTAAPIALFALDGNPGPPGPPGADGSDALWQVNGTTMSYTGGHVGIGAATASSPLTVFNGTSASANAIMVDNPSESALATGVWCRVTGGRGTAFYGFGSGYYSVGAHFKTTGYESTALKAVNTSSNGPSIGVHSIVDSNFGWAGYFEGQKNYFSGRIGINEVNPTELLHIAGGEDNDGTNATVRINSGSQTMLLDGNEIDTLGGNLYLNHNSSANVYMGTGGGRVGIGTYVPTAKAHISSASGEDGLRVQVDGFTRLLVDDSGNVMVGSGSTPSFTLQVGGVGMAGKPGGGSWSNSSDRRLKKNIHDLENSLDRLLELRGVSYEYKDPEAINERSGMRIGMIAQEVEEVFPDWVDFSGLGYKTLTFRGFEALAVEALRELRAEKDAEIAAIYAENLALQARIDRLEQLVEQLISTRSEEAGR